MSTRVTGFDWDKDNWPKCGKHGVSLAEIEALFKNGCDVFPDPKHSGTEERMLAVGKVAERFILAAFTLRNHGAGDLIRPISARYMHKKEIEHYERQKRA